MVTHPLLRALPARPYFFFLVCHNSVTGVPQLLTKYPNHLLTAREVIDFQLEPVRFRCDPHGRVSERPEAGQGNDSHLS